MSVKNVTLDPYFQLTPLIYNALYQCEVQFITCLNWCRTDKNVFKEAESIRNLVVTTAYDQHSYFRWWDAHWPLLHYPLRNNIHFDRNKLYEDILSVDRRLNNIDVTIIVWIVLHFTRKYFSWKCDHFVIDKPNESIHVICLGI